jgi:hypothetical protein
MGNEELVRAMVETAHDLQAACQKLDEAGRKKAVSEDRYRHAKSVAMVKLAGVGKNVQEREARVYLERVGDREGEPVTVGDLRYQRDMYEASALAALELVRSLRGILSAFQTQANALKEEARLSNYGPGMEP